VPSTQLAAQLTYLDASVTEAVNTAFANSFRTFCELIEDTRRWVVASYLSDPTALARSIFKNNYLIAKRVGSSLLKVWPCAPLNHSQFEFLPTHSGEACFEYLPIAFISGDQRQMAFLNPTDMTIVPSSKTAPCGDRQRILIQMDGKTIEVDQITGDSFEVQVHNPIRSEFALRQPVHIPSLHPLTFRHLVILNLSYLITHAFTINAVQVSQFTYKIQQSEAQVKTTLSDEWSSVQDAIVEKATGSYLRTWNIVLTVVVVICGIDMAIRAGIMFLEARVGEGRLGRLLFGKATKDIGLTIEELGEVITPTNPNAPTPVSIVQRCRRALRGQPKTPVVNTLIKQTGFHTPLLPIMVGTIKGNPVRVLFDTGATVTVAPLSIVKKWGVRVKPIKDALRGIGQTPLEITGQAYAALNICSNVFPLTIMTAKGKCEMFNMFDIILGTDSMKNMGELRFDFNNCAVKVIVQSEDLMNSAESAQSSSSMPPLDYSQWLFNHILSMKYSNHSEFPLRSPTNMREVIQLLGVTAKIQSPAMKEILTPIIKIVESGDYEWTKECEAAYQPILNLLFQEIDLGSQGISDKPLVFTLNNFSEIQPRPISATIPISINGNELLALADTGATLTVAPMSLARQLGCELQPASLEAVSASGHKIKIGSSAIVEIRIGEHTLRSPIHFINDELNYKLNDYRVILGCDLFQQLPPIVFDFKAGQLTFGEAKVEMNPCFFSNRPYKIRTIEHLLLKPGSQTIVKAKIDSPFPIKNLVLIDELDSRITEMNIGTVATATTPINNDHHLRPSAVQAVHLHGRDRVALRSQTTGLPHEKGRSPPSSCEMVS
jgi:hypothetical protein